MRLLNANTLVINNYYGNIPPYAILSHVWGEEEVTFQDFQDGKATELKGYTKIMGCCKQAITDSLEYVWIDTCCIDKRSSSELQEAINSMFNFYRDAAVCYALLQDVDCNHDPISSLSGFSKSRWFKRGWTLQELLAPSLVVFYASDWTSLGTRDELQETVAMITKIDREFFSTGRFSDYSIAQKFSWASGRQTTRVEDEAYCLLGLFSVSMPLLYGEGRRAFTRLQEELMKASDDHSIFAWSTGSSSNEDSQMVQVTAKHRSETGALASSPAAFAHSGHIIRSEYDGTSLPYLITNMGLSINLPLIEPETGYGIPYIPSGAGAHKDFSGVGDIHFSFTPTGTLAVLNCRSKAKMFSREAIIIEQTEVENNLTRYTRTNHSLGLISLPLADVKRYGNQKNALIQAHSEEIEGVSSKPGNLVIIKDMPEEGFRVVFTSKGLDYHIQTNGCVSFRLPATSSSEYEQVDITFEDTDGRNFCISITVRGRYDKKTLTASITAGHGIELRQKSTNSIRSQIINNPFFGVRLGLKAEKLAHAVRIAFPEWSYVEDDTDVKQIAGRNIPPNVQQTVSVELWN